MKRVFALVAALAGSAAPAQQSPVSAPTPSAAEVRLHQDWAYLARYGDEDATLDATPKHPRIVFMGDSITQGWRDKHPAFFTDERIGRGISGQTTPQMLLRFRQDVIDLHPAVVQIMAGTNDIAGNTGAMAPVQTEANFRSMVELAQAHGIRVILASIPPADLVPWRREVPDVAAKVVALNAWLRGYAAQTGSVYADYWAVLQDGHGAMKDGLSSDHVHPTAAGYDAMEPVARAAIAQALARPAPTRLKIAR